MANLGKSTTAFCPICCTDAPLVVKDSRRSRYSGHAVIRRRRVCQHCNGKFTTLELPTVLLDDSKLRAEILKRVFDKVYEELMEGAPSLDAKYSMTPEPNRIEKLYDV